jgi:hypothetical protein
MGAFTNWHKKNVQRYLLFISIPQHSPLTHSVVNHMVGHGIGTLHWHSICIKILLQPRKIRSLNHLEKTVMWLEALSNSDSIYHLARWLTSPLIRALIMSLLNIKEMPDTKRLFWEWDALLAWKWQQAEALWRRYKTCKRIEPLN